ncbi:hypothetical protein PYV61_21080, partial [Roseisolibacter sp. H3M3-2]
MNLSSNSRRLALLGVALSLTLASAAWLFFGAHEPAAEAAPAPKAVAVAPTAGATTAAPAALKAE